VSASPPRWLREVAQARILDGAHLRSSAEAETELGRGVGELTVRAFRERALAMIDPRE